MVMRARTRLNRTRTWLVLLASRFHRMADINVIKRSLRLRLKLELINAEKREFKLKSEEFKLSER